MPLAVSSAVLIGIAYPIPSTDVSEYFTVFIPITSPLPFSKAPPLLPGLMAALVWSNVIVLSVNATSLLTALITPVVTDWPYPKALPMAIALSPAFNWSESPITITAIAFFVSSDNWDISIVRTATSLSSSYPLTVAVAVVSSENWTDTSLAPSTTW